MTMQLTFFKIIQLRLIALSTNFTNAFQQPRKIKVVTIDLDGAEINGVASLKLNSGKSEITFND